MPCRLCVNAGLSAARQLRNHGYKVVVLEGADRPGGRVHTHRLEVGTHRQKHSHWCMDISLAVTAFEGICFARNKCLGSA